MTEYRRRKVRKYWKQLVHLMKLKPDNYIIAARLTAIKTVVMMLDPEFGRTLFL